MSKMEMTTAVQGHKRGPATILVVEDDLALLRLIEKRLQQCGFQTKGVGSGAAALSWLAENSPRLMLLDYSLPDMVGDDLLAQLESQGREVPFVVATGHGSETVAVEMMKRGARDYLIKGTAFTNLLPAVIEKALARLDREERLRETVEPPPPGAEATVFIVDDDPAVRQHLETLLQSMRLRTESYASAREFLGKCDRSKPGCLMLDVRMPQTSGLELLERLQAEEIHLPVIVMSAYGDVPVVVRAMKAGALDFLEKPCRDHRIWEAIQEALKRDSENRGWRARKAEVRQRVEGLAPGERKVLDLLVEGCSNREIAGRCSLSIRTIEARRAKVMQKMKARSLAELVRLVLTLDGAAKDALTTDP